LSLSSCLAKFISRKTLVWRSAPPYMVDGGTVINLCIRPRLSCRTAAVAAAIAGTLSSRVLAGGLQPSDHPKAQAAADVTQTNPLGIHRIADVARSVFIVTARHGFDLDHDSKREFIIRKDELDPNTTTIETYEHDGNGLALVHSLSVPGSSGYYPSDAGDSDDDGRSDMTMFGRTVNDFYVRLYESQDANSYPTQIVWELPVPWWVVGAKIADTDMDGRKEIVIAGLDQYFLNRVAIYEATGADNSFLESFYASVPEMSDAQSLEIVDDADGDGRPEIVFGGLVEGAGSRIHVFEANYDGAYAKIWSGPVLWNGFQVNAARIRDAGDLDGDGRGEFIVAGLASTPAFVGVAIVFEGQQNDSFQPVASLVVPMTGADEVGIAVGDIDADGKREIALGVGEKIVVYQNTGDNAWNQVWQGAADIDNSVGAGDHDGDGAEEFIFRRSFNATGVFEGAVVDTDSDGVSDALDNCPVVINSSQEDADADTVGDSCDNCVYGPNADQGPAVLGQQVLAISPADFAWPTPAAVVYLRGGLAGVSSYETDFVLTILMATGFTDATSPILGQGFYYLVKPDCAVGSWQSELGSERMRDVILP
jgi:hypothetical protein